MTFIPLGSVVLLKGGTKRVMIMGHGLSVKDGEETYFFDYAAVLYPEGFIGQDMLYFNHEDIETVFFTGYDDDDNKTVNIRLNEFVAANPNLKRRNNTPKE